jgi:hypothetical protein
MVREKSQLCRGVFMAYIVLPLPSDVGGNPWFGHWTRRQRQHKGVVIFLSMSCRPFWERPTKQLEVGDKVKH